MESQVAQGMVLLTASYFNTHMLLLFAVAAVAALCRYPPAATPPTILKRFSQRSYSSSMASVTGQLGSRPLVRWTEGEGNGVRS